MSHLAAVDKQCLAFARTELATRFVAGEEPETGGDSRTVEKLWGQRDDAVHKIGLDNVFAYVAFAALIRGERPVSENESGDTGGGKMMNDMLDPGEVGIADRGYTVLPAHILTQPVSTPIGAYPA